MWSPQYKKIFHIGLVCLFTVALTATAFGQGKGRGGGVGGGRGSGGGTGGPPPGAGVDRGLGNASARSGGRSDEGLNNASVHSNGRSDAGHERARLAADNRRRADKELRDHPGMPQVLHTNANDLRRGYDAALLTNPNLKFGQYVAATRLSQNLHSRFPNITRDGILTSLANGNSLGQTLQNFGLSSRQAKEEKKRAEQEVKNRN